MMISRRLPGILALATALAIVAAAPAGATDAGSAKCAAVTALKPGNEVRTDDSDPVESRASGIAALAIRDDKLYFSVAISNPARETFTAGHIHMGAEGANGGVVVTLFNGPAKSPRLFFQADVIKLDDGQAEAICGNLAGHYINYHTTQDPQGAVRGQLR